MADTIQDRIAKVREALGLTQKDFCTGIFVSHTYFSNIENGNRKVNDRIIALICSQYGVTREYLLEGKGEMFSDDLADIQLSQLLEIFAKLEKPFKEYIVLQVKQLTEAIEINKSRDLVGHDPESQNVSHKNRSGGIPK
ncbi:MAG: helix-turn-helix transcriptional regulator [Treponema sp.]|nr:helix-turn-helix transcriptional regulator [Treponema sp.]